MIAGAVEPALMDLRNRELVEAHLYSTWLAITGLSLGNSMAEILDLENPDFPILSDKRMFLKDEHSIRYESEAITTAW